MPEGESRCPPPHFLCLVPNGCSWGRGGRGYVIMPATTKQPSKTQETEKAQPTGVEAFIAMLCARCSLLRSRRIGRDRWIGSCLLRQRGSGN